MDLLSASVSGDVHRQRSAAVVEDHAVSGCVSNRGQTKAAGGGPGPERSGGERWQGEPGEGEARMGARDVQQRGAAPVVGAGDLWRAIAVALVVGGDVEGGSGC